MYLILVASRFESRSGQGLTLKWLALLAKSVNYLPARDSLLACSASAHCTWLSWIRSGDALRYFYRN